MKRFISILFCFIIFLCGCSQNNSTDTQPVVEEVKILEKGDSFSLTGTVDYSDSPSDIGQEYCLITVDEKIEYYYIDIYGETSKWSSNVFYTKGEDTAYLKDFVGKSVTISGVFDAESHGIPYITNIVK